MFVPSQMMRQGTIYLDCQEFKGGGENMVVHHGGEVGKAGKTGKTLANHKAEKH